MKKIISFLGTTRYECVKYYYENIEVETKFIQECVYKILNIKEDEKPMLLIGLTERARQTNWPELKQILDSNNYLYTEISINDGKDDMELWDNFDLLYNYIDKEDEVYFDVTHSYRSIPLMVMSVLNYAKFIKNINVREIFYGAFEAKDEKNRAPVFNLSVFNQITDWTIASEKFLETGDSRALARILKSEINPILREKNDKSEYAKLVNEVSIKLEQFSAALYTVRGNEISKIGLQLRKALEKIKDEELEIISLIPFNKILNVIYDKVQYFSGDIVLDIHNTVKICKEFNLIQQAYTFILENIINYLCVKGSFEIYNEKTREKIARVVSGKITHGKKREEDFDSEKANIEIELKNYITEDLVKLFGDLGVTFRNDINHAGFRSNAMGSTKFSNRLEDFIGRFESIIGI